MARILTGVILFFITNTFTAFAQNEFMQIDYAEMERFVKDERIEYDLLLTRFEQGDPTLSKEEVAQIYYGFPFTDEYNSYKYLCRKESIEHIVVNSKCHSYGTYSLSRINALHSSIDRFLGSNEYKPATKYLDLYLIMFWWLEKNKDVSKLFFANNYSIYCWGVLVTLFVQK